MTGDADESGQAFLPRLHKGLQRAALPRDRIQLFHRGDRMELIQVKAVRLQTLKGFMHLFPCALPGTLFRFTAQEETPALTRHPRTDPYFGLTIRRRHIDMVDPRCNDLLDHFIGILLRDLPECRPTKDGDRAHVPRAPEPSSFHFCLLVY